MTKRERAKALKALDETEKKWRKKKDFESRPSYCPLCKAACYDGWGSHSNCIYQKVFTPYRACGLGVGNPCMETVDKAAMNHSRRPIFDAIRKMRRWVEAQ